jgi:threonyl-tRNA synthetase
MAAAIQNLWKGAKFGVGPAIDEGFYYDVLVQPAIGVSDLAAIEDEMRRLKALAVPFLREEVSVPAALARMRAIDQPFKVELIELLRDKGSTAATESTGDVNLVDADKGSGGVSAVTFYSLGRFVDLCRGPHVSVSNDIGEFKLTAIAGAYWRGRSENPQLQRLYGTCFATAQELEEQIWRIEERKKRDHRKIGKELKIFAFFDDVGPGLPFWLPRGKAIRDELEFLARQTERRAGYQGVATPEITKSNLFYRSRHLPYYRDDMYEPMLIDNEEYFLRPMNCPYHHLVYRSELRSHRDLPLRIAEYGTVYRYEASGALSGLMRTRSFCQNDAHIYCRPDQAKEEFIRVTRMHANYYEIFDIRDFYMRLSLPDMDNLAKYVDKPDDWHKALDILRAAMQESGYPYVEAKGEAAFYGPKIDFMIKSAIGTEYAIATNQLDFLASETFDLHYTSEDGSPRPLYVIHRAPLGSHERFIAFLIEHYAGKFPVWLSPVQVRIVPIADRHVDFARLVAQRLLDLPVQTGTGGVRADVDESAERMQKKIRSAQQEKIPYMLVVGDREIGNDQVAVRRRDGTDLGPMHLDAFARRLSKEILDRRDLA